MLRSIALAIFLFVAGAPVYAAEDEGAPGDYGYHHMIYHELGIITELKHKTQNTCCDGAGECRATYVNMEKKMAFIEGMWCPMTEYTAIRRDIELPDTYALVCAGKVNETITPHTCPNIFCVSVWPSF